jgi:AraC-like DNA-binding protein
MYREDGPSESLRDVVVCTWTRAPASATAERLDPDVILPDGCIDLVWDGESVFVAGPDTGPVRLDPSAARRAHAGVRFRPGAAPAFLSAPASALLDQRVPLEELWGASAARSLSDRLAASASRRHAVACLEAAVLEHASAPVDDLASAAVRAIARVPSDRVDALAARLGVSERTLHRRVGAAVGYGPKVLQRVVRFRRFLALAPRRDLGLADLAHAVGYADQAHLTRECRALGGRTPAELVGAPAVRFVQDGLTAPGARWTETDPRKGCAHERPLRDQLRDHRP